MLCSLEALFCPIPDPGWLTRKGINLTHIQKALPLWRSPFSLYPIERQPHFHQSALTITFRTNTARCNRPPGKLFCLLLYKLGHDPNYWCCEGHVFTVKTLVLFLIYGLRPLMPMTYYRFPSAVLSYTLLSPPEQVASSNHFYVSNILPYKRITTHLHPWKDDHRLSVLLLHFSRTSLWQSTNHLDQWPLGH